MNILHTTTDPDLLNPINDMLGRATWLWWL